MTLKERWFTVTQQPDGRWLAHMSKPDVVLPGNPVFSWDDIASLRRDWDATDHFDADDFRRFCDLFGPPPTDDDV